MRRGNKLKSVLDQSTHLFVKRWVVFARVVAVFIIPLMLLYRCFWDNELFTDAFIQRFSLEAFYWMDNAAVLVTFLFFLIYLSAMIKTIQYADEGKPFGVMDAYRWAWGAFGSYLWVKILFVLKVALWSLLFVVPGIIFGIFYCLSGMAFVIDGKKGEDAFIYSRKIVRTNFAACVGCVAFIVLFLSAVCAAVVVFLDGLIVLARLKGHLLLANLIDAAEVLTILASSVFLLVFVYYLYKELKSR